ncbi:MAG: type IV pilus biogenesis/stability protein PilW [Pseudomonadota bacterium]
MRVIILLITSLILISCATQEVKNSNSEDIKVNPKAAEVNVQLGAHYISEGEYKLADDKLKRAFKQDPRSSMARWTYAIMQEKLEQPEAANYYYKEALRINPKDSQGQYNYGSFLCRQKKYKESENHFVKALADPLYQGKAAANLNAGVCLMEVPDYDRAEGYFKETLRLQPNNRVAMYQMAKLNYLQGNYAQAQSYIRDFEELSPHSPISLLLAYQIEKELGNTKIASSYAKELRQNYPASEQARQLIRIQ